MIKYIELHGAITGEPILFKADAIREIVKTNDSCSVNEIRVKESYEQVKDLLKVDPRRVYIDGELDFRFKILLQTGVIDIIKMDPGESGIQIIKRLLDAANADEAYQVLHEAYVTYEYVTRSTTCDLRSHSKRGGDASIQETE